MRELHGALDRGLAALVAGLNIPVDVFNDHDGVIYDHTQYEYQAEERLLDYRGAGKFEQDES